MAGTEHIRLTIDGTTSAVKYFVPTFDTFRLVGMTASVNAAQSDTATVKAGLASATDHIFEIDFDGASAGDCKKASHGGSVTDTEKKQKFDNDTPLEIEVNLQAAGKVVVDLEIDPFLIDEYDFPS